MCVCVVDRRVKVYWKAEHAWFTGFIDKVDAAKGCHVLYDDGDEDWHRMPSVLPHTYTHTHARTHTHTHTHTHTLF